ncbi:XPC-binding domain-containing protein [Lipomyces oligophaga]|uniref:XPC-binding domain-containing protein n=1 Tax=Lipomyces oligophaga TaxID=45792 RepID=UPI0034CFA3C3
MQLTLRDIKRQKWTVDVEPADTILSVKKTIAETKGMDADLLLLIYSGKVLADDRTVESYSIKETDYVVCMVSKNKQSSASTSKSSEPVPQTPAQGTALDSAASPSTSVPVPQTPASATVAVPAAPAPAVAPAAAVTAATGLDATPTPAAFNNPSAFSTGSARQTAIENMVEMGYDRETVERAMRAAFNNPDRAVDYLLNGIPDSILQDSAPRTETDSSISEVSETTTSSLPVPPAAAVAAERPVESGGLNLFEAAAQASQRNSTPTPSGGIGAGVGAGAVSGDEASLDFLRTSTQFQQLRDLVRQQPTLLEPILMQVAQANPQLAATIQSNPEAFIRLLTEGLENEVPEPGAYQIQVTPEESAAIDRLCSLGFHRNVVIQAYFACDKNEEVAANYLFEHGHEDDE